MKGKRGASSQDQAEYDILKLALGERKLSFSEIEKALKTKYSISTVSKYLKFLVIGKLVGEKGVRIDGKYHPRYSLTPKGRKKISKQLDECMLESSETIIGLNIDSATARATVSNLWPLLLRNQGIDASESVIVRLKEDKSLDIQPRGKPCKD